MKLFLLMLMCLMAVVNAENKQFSWFVTNYPDQTIAVGETVTLTFNGGHDVTQVFSETKFNACDDSGSQFLSSSTWTFTGTTEGTFYFICNVSFHCGNGQKIKITVVQPTDGPSATPSVSPSASPSASPIASTDMPSSSPSKFGDTVQPSSTPSSSPSMTPSSSPSAAPAVAVDGGVEILADTEFDSQLAVNSVSGSEMKFFYKILADNKVSIKLTLDRIGWLGFAIAGPASNSNRMIGGVAVIGMDESSNPTNPRVGLYDMVSNSQPSDIQEISGGLDSFENYTFVQQGGQSILQFVASGFDGKTLSGEQLFLFAHGSTSNSFGFHSSFDSKVLDLFLGTESKINLTANLAVHYILMTLSFGIGFPLGIVMAVMKRAGLEGWFTKHKYIQMTSFLLSTIGAVLGILVVSDRSTDHFSKTHHKVGLVVMAFVLIQPLNGLLRPHVSDNLDEAKSTGRAVWEVAHRAIGYGIMILGFQNILLGVKVLSTQIGGDFTIFTSVDLSIDTMELISYVLIAYSSLTVVVANLKARVCNSQQGAEDKVVLKHDM